VLAAAVPVVLLQWWAIFVTVPALALAATLDHD
jgi:hypothetical protein